MNQNKYNKQEGAAVPLQCEVCGMWMPSTYKVHKCVPKKDRNAQILDEIRECAESIMSSVKIEPHSSKYAIAVTQITPNKHQKKSNYEYYQDYLKILLAKDDSGKYIRNWNHDRTDSWFQYRSNVIVKEVDDYQFKYEPSDEIKERLKKLNRRFKDFELTIELDMLYLSKDVTIFGLIKASNIIKERAMADLANRINFIPIPEFPPGGIYFDLSEQSGAEMIYNALGVPRHLIGSEKAYNGLLNTINKKV